MRQLFGALLCCAAWYTVAEAQEPAVVGPETRYAAVARALEEFIEREVADKRLPALSISLVDDQSVVWARGFGFENPRDSVRATASTVYRVGSVSKLFTDIGVMQLVERRTLDLDAPVSRYLRELRPRNPFGTPPTLRQLMAHRSGLVREPPVGHYFDSSGVSLAATVRSLNGTSLVYAPASRTKYSNAAIATVGYVLERSQGEPFARYLRRAVLAPMGLERSAFVPESTLARRLARAVMWTYDGREFDAPTFELGMSPAGSMYSTVTDLGRFMSVLFRGGDPVLRRETLEEMWTPQFADRGARSGYGIGFALDRLGSERVVRHGGAIYGFATELAALPDARLGVAVAATKDGANGVTGRIATVALEMMLAARAGRAPVPPRATSAPSLALARRLAGRYGRGDAAVDLVARDSTVYMSRVGGGERVRLRVLAGDTLIVDDAQQYGTTVELRAEAIVIGADTLQRTRQGKPAPLPPRWKGLIGEYGWDYHTLFVLEKAGRLTALIEWFSEYPLREISDGVFAFPDFGLYHGERLVFTRGAGGRARRVVAAGVTFPRRPIEGEDGATFHITPQQPVAELRAAALAAQPPRERGTFRQPDLVELNVVEPGIRLDIRYATTNNFIRSRMYGQARAFLQRPAAEAVARAHRALRAYGYGLLVHDAYRPWYVTKMFWDATPERQRIFVADPSQGSRHNRGAAVDLTMYDLRTGRPVQMVGGYDEFSERSFPDYPGGTSLQRWHRELLRSAMEAEGFRVYDQEWWHFDYRDWREYPIGTATFDEIAPPR